jgi:hypothetical protein
MRVAEILTAAALMALALYFMWHATVLPIGWERGSGPGGGAFPFWLAAIMLLASGAIFVRGLLAAIADRGSQRAFIGRWALRDVLVVLVGLLGAIALIPFVGAYVALPLFVVYYLRLMSGPAGQTGWVTTIAIALATPVTVFFFFEVTLKILLPKGITEPLFIPLYAQFF